MRHLGLLEYPLYHQIFFDQASRGFLVELKNWPPASHALHAWRLSLSLSLLHRPCGLVWGGIKWKTDEQFDSSWKFIDREVFRIFPGLDCSKFVSHFVQLLMVYLFFSWYSFGKTGCPDCVDERLQATPTKGAQDRATTSARCMMTSTQRLGVLHH